MKSIFEYVKTQESSFDTDQVQVGENWDWNFRNHVQIIFHLKNGVFFSGENNWLRSFKNIMEPMLSLAYWTEDIEVKDVVFFVEGKNGRAMSFLLKKYHDEVYTREHDLDTLFDEITESDLDYGGVLVQKTDKHRPEVIPLNTIAFCDQTDIEGGPIGFKHYFSPEKLRSMSAYGWGDKENGATISLDDLIAVASAEKEPAGTQQNKKNKVTGKSVEVYIIRGSLPKDYLHDNGEEEVCQQIQIVAFYTDKENKEHGVTLYRKEDYDTNLLFHTSKKVHGRALGRGVGESLLHPQIWTNFLSIHKMQLLAAGAKVPLVTDDPNFTNRNKIQDMENLEVAVIDEGKSIVPVQTAAVNNIQLYERSISEWFEQAQLTGAAFDPILGKEQASGTTFRGQERTVAQGRGLHDRRRGQRAKFIEKIYREWIIPRMMREITKGQEFITTLSTEELAWVVDQMSTNYANEKIKKALLEGRLTSEEERKQLETVFKQTFAKTGNKKLLKILKDEFKDVPIRMGINIAGKQKDLAVLSDKLLSVFQFIFANPQGFQQAMQIPALSKSFSDILEFSGMSQVDFSSLISAPAPVSPIQPQQAPQQAPQIALSPAPVEA